MPTDQLSRTIPVSNTILNILQMDFSILPSAHFKNSFNIKSFPHDLSFFKDLIVSKPLPLKNSYLVPH